MTAFGDETAIHEAAGHRRVDVIQDDIDRGRHEATRCPVARAIRRDVGRVHIFVDHDIVEIAEARWLPAYPLARFIDRFDEDRRSVEPGIFWLVPIAQAWARE